MTPTATALDELGRAPSHPSAKGERPPSGPGKNRTPDPARAARWRAEVVDWLFGWSSKRVCPDAHGLTAPRRACIPKPLRAWWILEGQHHALLGGPLRGRLEEVAHRVQRLLRTHNPRFRPTPRPEGEVDWSRTLEDNAGQPRLLWHYTSRVGTPGLSDGERDALLGWIHWVAHWAKAHAETFQIAALKDEVQALAALPRPVRAEANATCLRRWAAVCRRSRWPLLRQVAARSLASAFEPVRVDALPVPRDPATLFELVCLVRILRCIEPNPSSIRLFGDPAPAQEDTRASRLEVRGKRARARHQYPLSKEQVTAAMPYTLRESIHHFAVDTWYHVDGFIELLGEHAGPYQAIVVEAKSGDQRPSATVDQLWNYTTVLRHANRQRRLLALGVVASTAPTTWIDDDHGRWLARQRDERPHQDTFVFLSYDKLQDVVRTALGLETTPPATASRSGVRTWPDGQGTD